MIDNHGRIVIIGKCSINKNMKKKLFSNFHIVDKFNPFIAVADSRRKLFEFFGFVAEDSSRLAYKVVGVTGNV